MTAGSPALEAWADIDRSEVQEAGLNTKAAEIDLDPIVTGPWMDVWNTTHRNRHVDRYVESPPSHAAVGPALEQAPPAKSKSNRSSCRRAARATVAAKRPAAA